MCLLFDAADLDDIVLELERRLTPTLGDLLVGSDDRLEQVLAGLLLADFREGRPDLSALVADGVASDSLDVAAFEENAPTRGRVAPFLERRLQRGRFRF